MMKSKNIIILILFYFSSLLLIGQSTCTIKGSIPQGENKYIAIVGFEDLISQTKKIIAHTTADEKNNFTLDVPIKESIYALLQFGFQESDIYLEPGKTYHIQIISDGQYSPNSVYGNESLNYLFLDHSPDNINLSIQSFNQIYNAFIVEHFDAIYRQSENTLLDSIQKLSISFENSKHAYVKNYAKYRLASLEQIGHRKNKKAIFKDYFENSPILYQNIEYMSLFSEFYEQYLSSGGYNKKSSEIRALINKGAGINALNKLLETDPLLQNNELKDLVFLKSFSEIYNNANYKQLEVRKLILYYTKQTSFPEIKTIANDILAVFDRLKPGTAAPDFKLKNTLGETKSLEDYRGSYVLINFWKDGCPGCELQMKFLNDIITRFPSKVKIISISAAPHMGYDKSLKLKFSYPWEFFNFNNDYNLLNEYNIHFFPTFVLIDTEGKILKYPAPFPDGNLGNLLEKIILAKPKK